MPTDPKTNSIASAPELASGATAVLPHHRAHLAASGLSDDTILKAGIVTIVDPEHARQALNWAPEGSKPPVPAILFPYWGSAPYWRFKPDHPRKAKDGKPIKYEAPVNQPQRLYTPVSVCPVINDPFVELVITEGEKKALAGCQAGIPTVAGSGIYGFHDVKARQAAKDEGRDEWILSPDLAGLAANRQVLIAFDSDIDSNPKVMAAAAKLATMLMAVGATVRIAFLPAQTIGAKVGLDDLYVACHRDSDAFKAALAECARPAAPNVLLKWLSGRWPSWGEEQRAKEIRRALELAGLVLAPHDASIWRAEAAKVLSVPIKDLKAVEASIKKDKTPKPVQSAEWMSAPGFTVSAQGDQSGVWKNKAGDEGPRLVAPAPINIVEVGEDEDGVYYTSLRWQYGHEVIEVTTPRILAAGSDLLSLAARGAPITQANKAAVQEFLFRQEHANLAKIPRIAIYNRFGWSRNLQRFVLGREVIGGEGRAVVEADERFLAGLTTRGSFAVYRALIEEVINSSPAAEAAFSIGYAAPLLRLLNLRSFLVSIWGPSHGGKSAVQAMAVSPWGQPESMKLTGDSTPTAIEANLARCRDLTAWVDDTQQARSKDNLTALAYQVGGGTGRGRGTVTGGLRPVANWLAIGFVSGEHPLIKIGAAAGARNRSLELRVTPLTTSLAAHVHQTLDSNHGLTGRAFLDQVLAQIVNPGKVAVLAATYAWFQQALDPTGKDQSAKYVALIALADYLARIFVLLQEDQVARTAAVAMGVAVLAMSRSQPDAGVDTIQAGYEAIVAWVAEHDGFFDGDGPKCFGRFLTASECQGQVGVAALREPLNEALSAAGFDLEEVMHGLLERGLLLRGESDRLARKTTISNQRVRAYWIVLPDTNGPTGGGAPPPAPGGGGPPGPG